VKNVPCGTIDSVRKIFLPRAIVFYIGGREGYFPLIPLLWIEKLGYPSCSTQLINKNGGQHC